MKSNLLLATSLLLTMGLMAVIVYNVARLDKSLVKQHGTIKEFKKRWAGARSDRVNNFRTEEYNVTFSRAYSGLSRVLAKDRAADLLVTPQSNNIAEKYTNQPKLREKQERKALFYILASDQHLLHSSKEEINYFYLKLNGDDQSKLGYYTDLYAYVVKEKAGILIVIISFLASLALVAYAALVNSGTVINNKLYGSYIVFIVAVHLFIILF